MNRFSIFVLLFFVCSSTCVHLENLCPADRFEYKLVEVNSFHRIRQQVTFEPIDHYLVGDSFRCDPNEFKNRTNYLDALKLKEDYNHKMSSVVFSDGFLNESSYEDLNEIYWELDKISLAMWKIKYSESDRPRTRIQCLLAYDEIIKRGKTFVWNIMSFAWGSFPQDDHSPFRKTDFVKLLNNLIKAMHIDGASQIFVFTFTFMPLKKMCEQPIIRRREVTFGEPSAPNMQNMQSGKRPTLNYDIFLPFHRRDYREPDPCVPRDELPLYLAQKKVLAPKRPI